MLHHSRELHLKKGGEKMEKILIVSDFDGTLAKTMENPNGVGVIEAYEMAIDEIFGPEAVEIYKKTGGLKNESPSEVIGRILTEELILKAKKFFHGHQELFTSLSWGLSILPEMLTRVKLLFLMKEIDQNWPLPYPGVINFLKQINRREIGFGIISSGHTQFISKVFSVWEIPLPKIIVTDDDFRTREDLSPAERIKPSRVLFDLLHARWAKDSGITHEAKLVEFILKTREKMVYIGDDPKKDGELARQAGVPFLHFCPFGTSENIPSFKNWEDLERIFFF